MKKLAIYLVAQLLILSFPGYSAVPINYDTYLTASIEVRGEVDSYTFNGKAGEHITLRAQSFGENYFDIKFQLENPAGSIDTADWDKAGGYGIDQANIIDYPLKATGQYTIYVSETGGDNTSQYWLSLQCKENIKDKAKAIAYDTYVADTITPYGKIKAFTFNGKAGEHITLRTQSFGENYFDIKFQLENPVGLIDTTDWDRPGGYGIDQANIIDYPLKTTGQYTIYVSETGGDNTSQYWLSLQCKENVKDKAKAIAYDTYVADTITPYGKIKAFTFNGKAGEHITLRAQSFGENYFDIKFQLENPVGLIDTTDWDRPGGYGIDQANIIDYPLKTTGQYTIYVSETGGDNTSQYWLSLQCKENVKDKAKAIAYDTYVADTITPFGKVRAYTFNGKAGEHITLRANSFGESYFDIKFQLENPAGSIDTTDWDRPGGYGIDQANIIDYPLKATGQYTIYVSETGGDNTSQYWLSLQCKENIKDKARAIAYDTYVSDTITPFGKIKAFTFKGKAGEHITLRAQSFGENYFDIKFQLENPAGSIDTTDWDRPGGYGIDQANIIDYPLKATGQYTIYVSETGGDNTSQYWLSLQCREEILTRADTLKTHNGTIVKNLENYGDLKAFIFLVTREEDTSLKIVRKAGNVEPYFQLFGPADSLFLSQSASTHVEINDNIFTKTGKYILIVGDNNGDAMGSFELLWDGIRLNNRPNANAGANQTLNNGLLVTLDGLASSDQENDVLTYLWTAPAGITLSSTTSSKPTFTAPEVTASTDYTFNLVVNDGMEDSPADQVVITVYPARWIQATVFLEGAYTGPGLMNTALKSDALIPLSQPYNVAPWNYAGTESVTSVPAGVVDWVLVELRQAATPEAALPVTTTLPGWPKACFLKSDGSIVDPDGITLPAIGNQTITGNLYVIIRHRNHIDIMSSAGLTLTGSNYVYNFTDAISKAHGGSAGYRQIVPGVFGMVSGDPDADGAISVVDFSKWAIDFGKTGIYLPSDIDIDGVVSVLDFSKWATNFGIENISPLQLKKLSIGESVRKYKSQVPDVK